MAESTEAQGQVTEDQPGTSPAPAENAPKTAEKTASSQPAKEPAKDKGPSPWLKDLEGMGLSPDHLAAMDEYLGSQWQPRMTQFEQQAAEWSNLFGGDMERAQIMANIAAGLESDPAGTYRQIGELLELVDPTNDGAQPPADPSGEQPPAGDEGEGQDDPRMAFLDELMQERQASQADDMYRQVMDGFAQTYGDGFDEDLFNIALLAHGGDVQAADAWYSERHVPAEPPADPPPTSGDPVSPAPDKPKHANLKDAVNAWVSDREAAAA